MYVLFAKPLYLWLAIFLPLLIILHFYFLHTTQRKAMRFANFEALKRIAKERFVVKNYLVLVLRVLAFSLLILGVAQATVYYDGLRNDYDYVIAIDTSPSMLASDFPPNRLEVAKSSALVFVSSVKSNAEIGLVSFSGVTYVEEPLSIDRLPLRVSLSLLNISRISGTDISNAIVTATNMLSSSDQGKAIILFTDGVDTAGAYIDDNIKQAALYASSEQVVIHTIGLGSENALVGYLPQIYNLTTSMGTDSLMFLANATGGEAIFPVAPEELNQFFSTLDSQTHDASIPFPLDSYALLAGIIMLLIEWILINTRFRRVA